MNNNLYFTNSAQRLPTCAEKKLHTDPEKITHACKFISLRKQKNLPTENGKNNI
jgi:hypothetical protein